SSGAGKPSPGPVEPPPAPATETKTFEPRLIGTCTFAGQVHCAAADSDAVIIDPLHVTSVCKEMLEAAARAMSDTPHSMIVLRGDRNSSESKMAAISRAVNVRKQLVKMGVNSAYVRVEVGTGDTRTVKIFLASFENPKID